MHIVYGASGHGKVILDILEANGIAVAQVWDDNPKSQLLGVNVIHPDINIQGVNSKIIIAIGDNKTRKLIAERLQGKCKFTNAIHPSAYISKYTTIQAGTAVMANVVVNAATKIGSHVIINTAAVVEHDCKLADYVHISPNATLCGGVSVGEGTHIGAGATIIPGIHIGNWCVVGAGAVVIRDVPDNCIVVGNPARILRTV